MGRVRAIGATLLLCLLQGFAASAGEIAGAMPVGAETTVPIGHLNFCRDDPAECRAEPVEAAVEPALLTVNTIIAIAALNTRINSTIKPKSDLELYGTEEHWTYPVGGYGDCEDYALQKRRALEAMGIAIQNLLITVVKKRDGTGHAVLTLRSAKGDFILDNLDWRIRPWQETPYRFLKRQSSEYPSRWRVIEDRSEVLVSSVDD